MPTLFEAAVYYAGKGLRIFPVHYPVDGFCSCGGTANCERCKHPMTKHGFLDASSDLTQVKEWWTRWPDANIGCRMGNGVVALDVDKHKGGEETLGKYTPIGHTPEARTPKGGSHIWLAEPSDVELANAVERLEGLDLRTGDGYILLPPSRTLDGDYKWLPGRHLNGHFETCPDWLAEAFKKSPKAGSSESAILPSTVNKGSRDDRMFKCACRMRYAGMDREEIVAALLILNEKRFSPPLPESIVIAKAEQAAKFQLGSPELLKAEEESALPEGLRVGTVGELADSEYQNVGLPTGIKFIDSNSTAGGLKCGHLAVFSAFTGVGKTGMLLQIADYVASTGVPVCYGTFADSDATEIRNRLLIMRTGWKGSEGPSEPTRRMFWEGEKALVESLPIHIWDASTTRGGRAVDPFLDWCAKIGPGLIVGDYAQKIRSDKAKSMFERAEDACDALALAAKQMQIPVVLGSQLTRGSVKMGTVDTTRGSQEWEHAAAFHMKIKVFDAKEAEKLEYPFSTMPGISEWVIAKNRFTVEFPPQRQCFATWKLSHIRFEELL